MAASLRTSLRCAGIARRCLSVAGTCQRPIEGPDRRRAPPLCSSCGTRLRRGTGRRSPMESTCRSRCQNRSFGLHGGTFRAECLRDHSSFVAFVRRVLRDAGDDVYMDCYGRESRRVGGNSKFPIRGNRKPHTLVVGGLCPAFHDVGESNSEGAGGKCTDGRRGCC